MNGARLARATALESHWCTKRAGYGVLTDTARLHGLKDMEAVAERKLIGAARNHERLRKLCNSMFQRADG